MSCIEFTMEILKPLLSPTYSLFIIILLATSLQETKGIRIVEMEVPSLVTMGSTVSLACRYDLEGANLYSLTWWRGAEQFYQFSPSSAEPVIIYDSPGISVDRVNSAREVVVLYNVSDVSSGKYKCEVLEDYPSFHKDSHVKIMEVIEEPKLPPILSISKKQWSPGEELAANCTASLARPPSDLDWYINDIKISARHSQITTETKSRRPSLEMAKGDNLMGTDGETMGMNGPAMGMNGPAMSTSGIRTSGLSLVLSESHFNGDGRAILKCDATYKNVYHRYDKKHLINPEYKTAAPSQKLYGNAVKWGTTIWLPIFVMLIMFVL